MEYSRIFGSDFPNSIISVGNKKDIDNTVKDLIIQYNSYISSGNLSSANSIYEANKTLLEPYIINSKYFNRLEEEIFNIGLFLLKTNYSIIADDEPSEQLSDCFWYKDY